MQQMSVCNIEEHEKQLECVSHLFCQGPPGPLACQGNETKEKRRRRERGEESLGGLSQIASV